MRAGRRPMRNRKRILLHVPAGAATVALLEAHAALAVIFFLGFVVYELNEDWRIRDCAFVDMAGYLWGLALVGLAKWVLTLLR